MENASNPNKIIWEVINKKIGKLGNECKEIWLQSDDRKITHLPGGDRHTKFILYR
jgi:hypothetical protein